MTPGPVGTAGAAPGVGAAGGGVVGGPRGTGGLGAVGPGAAPTGPAAPPPGIPPPPTPVEVETPAAGGGAGGAVGGGCGVGVGTGGVAAAGALSGGWGVMGWTGAAFAVPAPALAAEGSGDLPAAAAGLVLAGVPPPDEPGPDVPEAGFDVVPPPPGEPEPPPPPDVVLPPPPDPTLPGAGDAGGPVTGASCGWSRAAEIGTPSWSGTCPPIVTGCETMFDVRLSGVVDVVVWFGVVTGGCSDPGGLPAGGTVGGCGSALGGGCQSLNAGTCVIASTTALVFTAFVPTTNVRMNESSSLASRSGSSLAS